MTCDETRDFIDCVAYGEARVKYNGRIFFCNGVSTNLDTGKCQMEIFQDYPVPDDGNWLVWHYCGGSREECMNAFLELKYWDGKSFYEVAPEMEWIDL